MPPKPDKLFNHNNSTVSGITPDKNPFELLSKDTDNEDMDVQNVQGLGKNGLTWKDMYPNLTDFGNTGVLNVIKMEFDGT